MATQLVPPKLKIYTDGGFADVEGFSLGNLELEVVVIGPPPPRVSSGPDPKAGGATTARSKPPSDNVAILALQSRRNEERIDTYQVFGRIHNYRAEPVSTEAQLIRHDPKQPGEGNLIDAIALKLPPQSDQAFKFDLPDTGMAELEGATRRRGLLGLGQPRFHRGRQPAQAAGVGDYEWQSLSRGYAANADRRRGADVTIATPEESKTEAIARDLRSGRYDLVIYDSFRPEKPPEANALYFGVLPPGPAYEKSKVQEQPIILDWDVAHPLMQYVRDLPTVAILKAGDR